MLTPIDDAILAGLLEVFTDYGGDKRIRLTPAGARAVGDDLLAAALESCKIGDHKPLDPSRGECACGERFLEVPW